MDDLDDLDLIEQHIKEKKDSVFIRNCISCAEVNFIEVCLCGYIELCRFMIKAGVNVNAHAGAALYLTSADGHFEIVKLLLDSGADVHAKDDSALLWASDNGHLEVVKLLLEAGADIHAEDDNALGWSSKKANTEDYYCLHLARHNGHTEVVKLLEDWIKSHG